ncbi:alginate lyase-domain-containing protein [Naematelia encephala]|uniref:Alginate lyase-domain-containing protein n=1 Tax=Naematelia encephala TaxID=71784 RepID=A0A1Y2B493_9TREE|nr:alginate lyase-domain-containing protein [Naematelia encephala]
MTVKLGYSTFFLLSLLSVQGKLVFPKENFFSWESKLILQAIIHAADHLAQSEPWSARSGEIVAASGNKSDYLSWASDYWPECNWCSSSTSETTAATQTTTTTITQRRRWRKRMDDTISSITSSTDTSTSTDTATEEMFSEETAPPTPPSSTTSEEDSESTSSVSDTDQDEPTPDYFKPPPVGPHLAAKKTTASVIQATSTTYISSSTGTSLVSSSTASSETATSSSGSCRPSPTSSMPPSATWISCPYVRRPGQTNSDTRDLPAYSALSTSTDATLLNALAFAFTGSQSYAANAITYIRTMFIQEETAINPNGMYGQFIRGPPGNQTGSYESIFDFRSLVKVVNAIQILKAGNMSEEVEDGMRAWAAKYRSWLEENEIFWRADEVSSHYSTSIYGQRAALYILDGDESSAASVLEQYFAGPFQSQITSTGEQPYEGSQANPFHARCTNIEAMILNAKLGASLNLDFWSVRSSQGATIRSEDANELLPHVAAVAAAYGDEDGRYRSFLDSSGVDYESQIWWFFDQPEAVRNIKQSKRKLQATEKSQQELEAELGNNDESASVLSISSSSTSFSGSAASSPTATTESLASTSMNSSTPSPTMTSPTTDSFPIYSQISITFTTSERQSATLTSSVITHIVSEHTNSASGVVYKLNASPMPPEQPRNDSTSTSGSADHVTQTVEASIITHEQPVSVSTSSVAAATSNVATTIINTSTNSASARSTSGTNSPSTPSSTCTPAEGDIQNLVTSANQQEAGPLTVEDLALALGLQPMPVRRSHVLRPRRHDSHGWKGMVRRFAEGF